jgi:MarR family transcriptional regulator, multiple antibiotic resistance protein MarR
MNPSRKAAVLFATPIAAEPEVPPKRGIIRLINRVRIEMIDALDRELSKFDISAAQLIVLASLENKEAGSAASLCKSISYDPGAMTRMVDRLEQKGLIRRTPHPQDRRATNLEITTAGRALYPQLLAAKETVQAQFLRGFSHDEVRLLESLLSRLVENR